MSAFVVNDKHLNALITWASLNNMRFHFASDGNRRKYDPSITEDAQALVEILYKENVRSVCARYPQDKPEDFLPAPVYNFVNGMSAIQIVKACNCLDYQSCETSDWKETDAYRIVDWIQSEAIAKLPGYNEAKWEIS